MDIRAILKGVLIGHMGTTVQQAEVVFPESENLKPITGVV
jgi:uncharacterized protein (DUF1501 family)